MPPIVPDYSQEEIPEILSRKKSRFGIFVTILLVVTICTIFLVLLIVWIKAQPPTNFPVNTGIEIVSGTSISAITKQLQNNGVVKSNLLLYVVLLTKYEPGNVKASTYYFETPLDVYGVAEALVRGDFDSDLVSFIHIEGERASHVAENAALELTDFNALEFMRLASTSEGKLFPETYRIPKDFTEAELLELMLDTYENNMAPLRTQIASMDITESEVVTLASIIEREANSINSMKMVAGILQNRLSIGMGLQVDASMEYILDKPLSELTAADLKMDTPYNTYLYRGLTPTPIGNPGLDAIKAVLEPIPSSNMFYITGDDGNFYYAKDFEGHKANVARYLR
jgi:UPF0755 protein